MSELLKINVNEHTEKKGQLTYLSWAWAWAEVLKFDPGAEWEFHRFNAPDGTTQPCMWVGDTAMVQTTVTIKQTSRSCMLPVMDNKNNAVKNPDARKISDAIMRCMTKAIAMHGLGLYIYAGEDLPQTDEPEAASAKEATSNGAASNGAETCRLAFSNLQPEIQVAFRRAQPQIDGAMPDVHKAIQIMGMTMDEWPDEDASELKKGIWSLLASKTRTAINNEQKA